VVVNAAASITLYMLFHLPTVKKRCLGHAGNQGMEQTTFARGALGKVRYTLKKASVAVKSKVGRIGKIGRDGAGIPGLPRTTGEGP
jgi:hypothetical protein